MYWNLPAVFGEVSDDGHSSTETFCATLCCPCYWLCCALTYCTVGGIELATSCAKHVNPQKVIRREELQAKGPECPVGKHTSLEPGKIAPIHAASSDL